MLTRRRVVASTLACAAMTATARFGAASAQTAGSFVRYNVASADGKAMLRTYAQGVKTLKAASGRLPLSWIFQWYIHQSPQAKATEIHRIYGTQTGANRALAQAVWSTCQAHMLPPSHEAFFLPWHRLYIGYFEQIIRAVTNTPTFTLPYWDYTDPASAAIPEEFQDRFAGDAVFGALHMPNRRKDDGTYAHVNAGEPINKYFKGRENFLTLADMSARAYDGATGFNQRLDGNLHGNIHDFVGDETNMASIPTAAGDPIFWLHHCNIDRIWYAWVAAGGKNPTTAAWLNANFTFAGADGKKATAPVRSIADITTLPYRYDALPKSPRTTPLIASRNVTAPAAVGAAAPGSAPPENPAPVGAAPGTPAPVGAASPPPAPPPPNPSSLAAAPAPPPTSVTTATAPAPIPLGATPQKVTLAPAKPHLGLRTAVPLVLGAGPNSNQRFSLILRGVQAMTAPGTVYKVYIDLPADASPEVAEQHFVGVLNFFDKVAMPGHKMGAMPGKSAAFDITDVVVALHLQGSLETNTTVTLVPSGTPNAAALTVIKDGIEIRRE